MDNNTQEKEDLTLRQKGSIILIIIMFFGILFGLTLWGIHESYGQNIDTSYKSYPEIETLRDINSQTYKISDNQYVKKVYLDDRFDTKTNLTTIKEQPIFEEIPVNTGIEKLLNLYTINDVFAQSATNSINNKDNWIYSGAATTNYGTNNTFYSLWPNDTGRIGRGLIGITLPTGSGTIGTISLNLKVQAVDTASGVTSIHELTRPTWHETQSTWNIYSTGNNWSTAGGDYSATVIDMITPPSAGNWGTWYLFGGSAENEMATLTWGDTINLLVKEETESGDRHGYIFHSKEATSASDRPYVEIFYTTEEETPPAETTTSSIDLTITNKRLNYILIIGIFAIVFTFFDFMRRTLIKK